MHIVELMLVGSLIYNSSKLSNNAVSFVLFFKMLSLLRCMKINNLIFFMVPMRKAGKSLGFS